ncbi:MAG: hypothetical protein IPL78_21110 [Chloroflexi bacterium]|nr:hypothetical protein [Chloroflexota bacterium]
MPGTALAIGISIATTPAAAAPGGVAYILRDEFTTDAAAPLTSPRACEPGPGSWTLTQATGAITIVSSQLEMTGTNAINSTRLVSVDSFARSAGLAILVDKVSGTANAQLGWSFNSTGTWDQGVFAKPNGGAGRGSTQQISPTIDDIMPSSVGYAIILRTAGAFVCYESSPGVWGIGFVYNALTTTPVYAVLHHYQNTKNILDNARVVQMAGDWSTDYGVADVHATPAVR